MDANKTSPGRVRDTDRQAVQQGGNIEKAGEAEPINDLHEGRYKPEMGTIVMTDNSPAPRRES